MAKQETLTRKNQSFCRRYAETLNQTASYVHVYGGSYATAKSKAVQLMKKPVIRDYIDMLLAESSIRTEVTLDRILREFAQIAFSDIGDILDIDGTEVKVKPLKNLSRTVRASIKKITVEQKEIPQVRSKPIKQITTNIEMYSKLDALKSLAQYLGMDGDWNKMFAIARRYGYDLAVSPDNKTLLGVRSDADVPGQSPTPTYASESEESE